MNRGMKIFFALIAICVLGIGYAVMAVADSVTDLFKPRGGDGHSLPSQQTAEQIAYNKYAL